MNITMPNNGQLIRMTNTYYNYPNRRTVDFCKHFLLFESYSNNILCARGQETRTAHILQRTYWKLIDGKMPE